MPFFTEDEVLQGTINPIVNTDGSTTVETVKDKTSFLEAARAWHSVENPVFRLATEFMQPEASNILDPNFKPIDELQTNRPDLIEYADKFIEVKNNEEYNRKVFNIDYELQQKEILSKASTPTHLIAALADSLVDPITLIPFAKVAKNASTLVRTASGAAKGLALGAATGLTREAILQTTSETRTIEQTTTNLIAESVAGTLFGGVIGALSKESAAASKKLLASAIDSEHEIKFVVDDFTQDMAGKVAYQQAIEESAQKLPTTELISPKGVVSLSGESNIRMALDINAAELAEQSGKESIEKLLDRSVGAAETVGADIGLAHINKLVVKTLSGAEVPWLEQIAAPELRAAISKSQTIQKLGDVFYDAPLIKKQHAQGISIGDKAESMISRNRRSLVNDADQIMNTYTEYTGKGRILSGLETTRGSDKISFREFSRRAFQNMTDHLRVDEIPGVNKLSQLLRSKMDSRLAEMETAGIFEGQIDKEFMRNYMTRAYDLDKLADPRTQDQFLTKVGNWLRNYEPDGTPLARSRTAEEADKIAYSFLRGIRGESDQAVAISGMMENLISKGKFTKERQLMIPDSEIQEFLIDDAFRLYNNYMERTGRMLAAKESLKKTGFGSIEDVIRSIKSDADKSILGITDEAEIAKINRYFGQQEKFAVKMYRSVLGQIRKPGSSDRYISRLLDYNYTRLLGGVTLSSLSEIAMPIFRFGMWNTIKDGWYPMIRSMKTSKITKEQLDDSIGALELKMNNALRLLDGVEDTDIILREFSKTDIAFKAATGILSKASFIGDWTAIGSGIAGQISSARLTRLIRKTTKSPEDMEVLASIGIDKSMYSRLEQQIKTHTQKLKGSYVINPHLWDDQEALNIFKSAVNTDVESTILKSGIGTQPLWIQENALGKVFYQFNSFMNAATSRVLISGIQRRDKDVLIGIIGLVHMGGMVQLLRNWYQGRDVELDYGDFITAGLSNSGVLGLMGTKFLDTYRTASDPSKARFLDSTVEGSIMGPTAGTIRQATKAIQGMTDDEVTNDDIKATLRFLPYSNLPYVTGLMNQVWPSDE